MKTWYLYNSKTKAYLFNCIHADSQPDNSTNINPGDITNPTWDSDKWVAGPEPNPIVIPPTDTDQLKTMTGTLVAENAKKDQAIKQLQTMTGTLVAQIAELNKGGK